MGSRELVTLVANRLQLFGRVNFVLSLLCPALAIAAAWIASSRGLLPASTAVPVFGLAALLTLFFLERAWRFVAPVKKADAAKMIDDATGAKERFLTVAFAEESDDPQLLATIAAQADRFSSAFDPAREVRFALERPARLSLLSSPAPLSLILFALFFHAPVRAVRPVAAQGGEILAEELREVVESSPGLPVDVQNKVMKVAELLEEKGIFSDEAFESVDSALEQLEELEAEDVGEREIEIASELERTVTEKSGAKRNEPSPKDGEKPKSPPEDRTGKQPQPPALKPPPETIPPNVPPPNIEPPNVAPPKILPPGESLAQRDEKGEDKAPEQQGKEKLQGEQEQSASQQKDQQQQAQEQKAQEQKDGAKGSGSDGKSGSGEQQGDKGQSKQGEKSGGGANDPNSGREAQQSEKGGEQPAENPNTDVTGVGEGKGKGKSGDQKEQHGEKQSGSDSNDAKDGDAENSDAENSGNGGGSESAEKKEDDASGGGKKEGNDREAGSKGGGKQSGGKPQGAGKNGPQDLQAVKGELEKIREKMSGKEQSEEKGSKGQPSPSDKEKGDQEKGEQGKNDGAKDQAGNKRGSDKDKAGGDEKKSGDKSQGDKNAGDKNQGAQKQGEQKQGEQGGDKDAAGKKESTPPPQGGKGGSDPQKGEQSEKDGKQGEKPGEDGEPGNKKERAADPSDQGKGSGAQNSSAGKTPSDNQSDAKFEPAAEPGKVRSERPQGVPNASDTAQRFGPFSGGTEGALTEKERKTETVVIPQEEKIIVRTLGESDGKRYKHAGQANAKTELGDADFEKPKADDVTTSQPIPVEYQDILR